MSAFNRKMTKAEIREMEDNRLHMLKIKRWFEFTITYEIICSIYLSSLSYLLVLQILAFVAGLVYIFMINRKDPSIIKKAIVVHAVLAFIVVGSAVSAVAEISDMTPDVSSNVVDMFVSGVSSVPDDVSETSESGKELLAKIAKVASWINLFCAAVIMIPPVFINAGALKKCQEYYSMSDKPGFPHFMTNVEYYTAFRKEESINAIEHYRATYGVEEAVYSRERNDFESHISENASEAYDSSPVYEPAGEAAGRFFRGMIARYREQITKDPENIYDYTVLSSYVVFIIGVFGFNLLLFLFAVMEVIILLFAMLPKNRPLIYGACVIHLLETLTLLGGGIGQKGIAGAVIFVFISILSIIQTVMYFMTARMLKKESDEEFERQRQLIKEKYEAERQRKIREKDENIRQDIERRKIIAARDYGMTPGPSADPYHAPSSVSSADMPVPEQNYSSWSKVDTDLASSMLSDLNE